MTETMVLIIDPDETSNQFLAQLLRKKGFKVFTSLTGKDALMRINDVLPGVIICDTSLVDIGALELVKQLQQDRRLSSSTFIAVSARYDSDEMENCLKAGFMEYFAKSGSAALALSEALPRLVSESAARVKKNENGLLIAFSSAKGGIGTSSLCANLAHVLGVTFQPATVCLLDLVLPMGSSSSITGYEGNINLEDFVERMDTNLPAAEIRAWLPVPHGWNFHFLPGSPNPEVASHIPLERLPDAIQFLRRMFNYIVVDFGRMLSRLVLPVFLEADAIILVVGTDNNSAELSSRQLQYIVSKGIGQEKVYPILNRAVGLQGLTKTQVETALGIEIPMLVPYMMDNFTLANNLHTPFITKFPNDSASLQLKQIAGEISRLAIKIRMDNQPAS